MDKQATSVVAYISFIGWILAFVFGDRYGAKFHLNQALVLNIFAVLGGIPIIGRIWLVFICICWLVGFIAAVNDEEKEIPLLGQICIIK